MEEFINKGKTEGCMDAFKPLNKAIMSAIEAARGLSPEEAKKARAAYLAAYMDEFNKTMAAFIDPYMNPR